MKRIGGNRRKSRAKMKIPLKERGKLYIQKFLQSFDVGQKVLLKAYPSHQGGLFNLRYYGKIAKVVGEQGKCYKVELKDGGKLKMFIVHPVHLIKV